MFLHDLRGMFCGKVAEKALSRLIHVKYFLYLATIALYALPKIIGKFFSKFVLFSKNWDFFLKMSNSFLKSTDNQSISEKMLL